jgi:DNA-directed RNA polymerase subunit RPC12/RpoP
MKCKNCGSEFLIQDLSEAEIKFRQFKRCPKCAENYKRLINTSEFKNWFICLINNKLTKYL